MYERDLTDVLEVGQHFDITRLPEHIQDIIKVVTAKAPSFSNVAALGVVNYGIAHVIGQLRPRINSPVYSSNQIGCNVYSMIISNSGAGKSSSVNTIMEAFAPALEIIDQQRMVKQIELAKQVALATFKKDDPKLQLEDITESMYQQYLNPLPRTTASDKSTRGGISTLVAKLQEEDFSNLSIIIDELGLALKSGNTIDEVLGFLTESFDMGANEAPEFKGEEVKERSIQGMYTNLLAHTSPKIVFEYDTVRDKLAMLFSTAYSRRCIFSFPDEDEACENNPIPETIAADKQLSKLRRDRITNLTPVIGDKMTAAVRNMVINPSDKLVTFSEDAASLYEDYYSYCIKRSEIMEDSSILQIEMAGRSFKLGKLAALWALAGGTNVISKELYESVIYYAEYNAKYLSKFVKLTNAQPFELLAELFKKGKTQFITLDSALTNGYINRVTKDFKEILDPLNSVLRTHGTCQYNIESKSFIYTPFVRVENDSELDTNPTKGDYSVSYTLLIDEDGNPTPAARSLEDAPDSLQTYKEKTDWVKEPRQYLLNNFDRTRDDVGLPNIVNLLKRDSIYSAFTYDNIEKDGVTVPNKRSQETLNSSTKLIVLDIDKSEISMEDMHEYLEHYKHITASSIDNTNKYKFRLIIPINVELSGTDTKLYSYVVKRLAADLLVTADKVSFNPAHPYYGYKNATVLLQEGGQLMDVTKYLTDYASDPEFHQQKPILQSKPKTEQGRKNHVARLLDDVNKIFDYVISAEQGEGSLMMARASMHMRDEFFSKEEYTMAMNYINSLWEYPMPESRFQKLINQYIDEMQ